jgi:hypothetical protein
LNLEPPTATHFTRGKATRVPAAETSFAEIHEVSWFCGAIFRAVLRAPAPFSQREIDVNEIEAKAIA